MSEATNEGDPAVDRFLQRLPPALRPLSSERKGSGLQRRIEAIVLVLLALLIAVGVVHDLTRQSKINYRLTADIKTWREITGHDYRNVGVETDARHYTTDDVACGNISFGKPGERTQICFVFVGPVLHVRIDGRLQERRATYGGFFVPPATSTGYKVNRYACFGRAIAEERCKAPTPPGASDTPPPGWQQRAYESRTGVGG